nr:AraC family transcriptional regulator [Roseibium polysiphoniae]
MDELAVLIADGLLANDKSAQRTKGSLIDQKATNLAREYLDENLDRIVDSEQLEQVTGLDRYSLARQFRKAFGTSPYRYLTMRRLDRVRADIAAGVTLVDAAMRQGFSDQSHMTRRFKASYGISPGHWQRLLHSS